MSCTLNPLVSIRNISGIIEWFQLNGVEEEIEWDTKWEDWDINEIGKKEQKSDNDWLRECLVCISSLGNVAIIAHKNRIAILTANDIVDDEDKATLSVMWKGTVGDVDGDEITDILCLPLVSQNRSSSGTPDWTCIIIGFKSGYVSVYSENGTLLFSQIYEEKPVVKIHCRTFTLGEFGIPLFSDMSTEFVVAYQNCVVSINGTQFLECLRQCRKRAAKVSAGSQKLEDLPALKYKKYSLEEQEYLSSCVAAGSLALRLYEKLVHQSLCNGFVDHVGGNVISKGHLLTVGEMPYFGIVEMAEDSTPVYLRDVALGLASKLKDSVLSAATDWFFPLKGSPALDQAKPKIEPATPAALRTFLPDRRRIGTSIALSPSRRLAAVTDSFGRVVVIDVVRGTAVKMWKGYRDAECGWEEVLDEWGGEKRKVTFLIIYAPRRGLLEVWLPQQGPRIAAFNVSKQASLLYNHHCTLGNARSNLEAHHFYPVLLLNLAGVIERIYIPFHLALSSKTDRQARDQHLLKEINSYMKKMDDESVISLIKELETVYGKLQFIIMLLNAPNFTIYLVNTALEILTEESEEKGKTVGENEAKESVNMTKKINEPNYRSHELKKLKLYLNKISRLVEFYTYITTHPENTSEISVNDSEAENIFVKLLRIKLHEIDHLPILSSLAVEERSYKKVKFLSETKIEFSSYVKSFQVIGTDVNNDGDAQINTIKLVQEDVNMALTDLILSNCEVAYIEEFMRVVNDSRINPLDLTEVLFFGWYNTKEKTLYSAKKFALAITGLFFLNGDFTFEDDLSGFWFMTLKCIQPWTNIPVAQLTAIICRGLDQNFTSFLQDVAKIQQDDEPDRIGLWMNFMQYLQSDDYKYVSLNEWEPTAAHLIEWNIFIGKIISLSGLYEMLRKQKSNATVSVRSVNESGSGYISELVAKYIIQSNIPPHSLSKILDQLINDPNELQKDTTEQELHDDTTEEEPEYIKSAFEDLAAVKENFGVSMERNCIICNVCWELGVLWQKAPNETKHLKLLVDFFRTLDYTVVSLGTAILIWQFLLRDRLFNVTELAQKFKRIPSDRMSIDKIGISQTALAVFLTESRRFLDSLVDLMVKGRTSESTTSSLRDTFWIYSNRAGLVDRARKANSELSPNMIHLHMDLIYVLELINEFHPDIKVHSLFADEQLRVLFNPLTDLIYNSTFLSVNPSVFESRSEFLKKIVSNGVQELPDDFDELITNIVPKFCSKTIELSKIWRIDADIIRRHYVVELMSSGFDGSAQHAMRWLNFLGDLPEQVFIIGGLRVKYLIDTLPGPQLVKLMTSISPLITNWTRTLKFLPLRNPNASLAKTQRSMESVFHYLPSTSSNYTPGKYLLMAFDGILREGFK